MAGRIPQHFIDDLLARVDIVDLIDKYVPLKKTGANYAARCPFHAEKTPSFSVNRTKQFFHCFGCGASGNAVGFLMDFSHLDFVEAIEDLALFAGVEVPRENDKPANGAANKDNGIDCYRFLGQVAAFYENCLRVEESGKQAVAYLKSRGIGDQLAKDFMLGYAPDEWRSLTSRFDQSLLVQTGMAIEKEGKVYDRFRGRVMFPIRDKRGRVVGFGGRVLDDAVPKYLNSPETMVFHKGKEVYGLYELLQKDGKPKRILVVEGYMDVIALAGHGIHYAVATLGTATSQAHLDLLFRFSSELVFCFDGDNAGRDAAWRAMEPAFGALKEGRQIRIMLLPQQHDPDSLVRAEGAENFAERLLQSQALSDYFFSYLSIGLKLNEMEGRSQLVNKAKPYLERLPPSIFRDMMFARLKGLTQTANLDVSGKSAKLGRKPVRAPRNNQPIPLPRRVMALLIQHPGLIDKIEPNAISWDMLDFQGVELFREMLASILAQRPANTAVLLEHYREHPNEKAIKALASIELFPQDQKVDLTGLEKELQGGLEKLVLLAKKNANFKSLVAQGKKGWDSN